MLARIHVTLKSGVNDPQGLAIAGGLRQLGFSGVEGVRAGRYLEVRLSAPDRAAAERAVEEMCQRLLANPVIERYDYEVTEGDALATEGQDGEARIEAEIEETVEEEA